MKHVTRALAFALAAAVVPAAAQESPKALQDAIVAAVLANDVDAIVDLYAEDAVLYPAVGAASATGREAIRGAWESFMAANTVQDGSVDEQGSEMMGDTAVSWGTFEMTVAPQGGGETSRLSGRFMDVAKQIDGRWVYVVDHLSLPMQPGQ